MSDFNLREYTIKNNLKILLNLDYFHFLSIFQTLKLFSFIIHVTNALAHDSMCFRPFSQGPTLLPDPVGTQFATMQ